MKKLLSILLFAPLGAFAQNAPKVDIGAVGAFFLKPETSGFGGSIAIRGTLNSMVQAGVGFMPLWMENDKSPQLPVYADIQVQLDPLVSLTLQPGYNFYESLSSMPLGNYWIRATTKGTFYGAAGLTFNLPKGKAIGFDFQAKYNYFGYQTKVRTQLGSNITTQTSKSDGQALAVGVGVRM